MAVRSSLTLTQSDQTNGSAIEDTVLSIVACASPSNEPDRQPTSRTKANLIAGRGSTQSFCRFIFNLSFLLVWCVGEVFKSSQFYGVTWSKDKNKWHAQGGANGSGGRHLGYYTSELDAAIAYDNCVRRKHVSLPLFLPILALSHAFPLRFMFEIEGSFLEA